MCKKMTSKFTLIILMFFLCSLHSDSSKENQLKYSRVRQAYKDKESSMLALLQKKHINKDDFISACNNTKTSSTTSIQAIVSDKQYKQKNSLNGVWGMTNYFDTIITKKELAKYRLQAPTWFAILLKIQNKNLYAYGSIYKSQKTIHYNSDTIATFKHFDYKWNLIKKDSLLTLIRYDSIKKETEKYIYRKREDLKLMIENDTCPDYFDDNVTIYFNQKILSGEYINIHTNKKIIFTKDGKIKGFRGYDSYRIRNYFGTLHPHNNLDVVRLINTSNNKTMELNWKFKNDKLILSKFNVEIVDRFGEKTPTDNFVLGKMMMELRKNN